MRKKKQWMSLLLGCLLLFSSCAPQVAETEESPVQVEIPGPAETSAQTQKEDAYIALYNLLGGDVYTALTHYQDACGWEPKLLEGSTGPSYQIGSEAAAVLAEAILYADASPAMEGLDQLVPEIVPILAQFLEVWEEMQAYYEGQGYLQDDYRQGQIYHTDILNLYNEMYPLITGLEEQVHLLDTGRRAATIAYCQEKGLFVESHLLQIIQASGELSAFLQAYRGEGGQLSGVPPQEFLIRYDPLIASINGFREAAGDGEQFEKELYITGHPAFADILEGANGIEQCAEALRLQVEEGKEPAEDALRQLDDWMYQITGAYNSILH